MGILECKTSTRCLGDYLVLCAASYHFIVFFVQNQTSLFCHLCFLLEADCFTMFHVTLYATKGSFSPSWLTTSISFDLISYFEALGDPSGVQGRPWQLSAKSENARGIAQIFSNRAVSCARWAGDSKLTSHKLVQTISNYKVEVISLSRSFGMLWVIWPLCLPFACSKSGV